jgi:predicted DNA-binding protein (UPF0278 family)
LRTLLIQNGKVIAAATVVILKLHNHKFRRKINLSLFYRYVYQLWDRKTKGWEATKKSFIRYQKSGHYWNENIKSEVNGYESFKYDQPKAEELLAGLVL